MIRVEVAHAVWVAPTLPSRLQHHVNVAPVETQLRSMAPVDFDLAIRDNLLDEAGNVVNVELLDRFYLLHDTPHALFKHDDLVVELVEDLLGVARGIKESFLTGLFSKRAFHVD